MKDPEQRSRTRLNPQAKHKIIQKMCAQGVLCGAALAGTAVIAEGLDRALMENSMVEDALSGGMFAAGILQSVAFGVALFQSIKRNGQLSS